MEIAKYASRLPGVSANITFAYVLVVGAAMTGCNDKLEEMTIEDILSGYEKNRFTAEEVTSAYINQIEKYEPAYNAFTATNPKALDQARDIDRRRRDGEMLGPLAGVPLVIKETMDHVDYPSTAGWKRMSAESGGVNIYPERNAIVVERLLRADAIILGKTNISVFSDDNTRANSSWAGATYNAVNRQLAPGASSSGTGTAVAAGFAAAGLGEETGGSIQNPSSAQSLVGVIPTFSLVPNIGAVPLATSTLDVIGPIAKTVYDAALLLDVIAGYSPDDPKSAASSGRIPTGGYTSLLNKQALKGKRIGLFGSGWSSLELSPETRILYRQAIRELESRRSVVIEDPFAGSGLAGLALPGESYDFRGLEALVYDFNRYLKGLGIRTPAEFANMVSASPFDEGEALHWYLEKMPALRVSLDDPEQAPDLTGFFELRREYREKINEVMTRYRLDALVFPQATGALPDLFSEDLITETTVSVINIAGLTGVTVPAGQYSGNDSPFALIFVGPPWSEAEMLALAYDYEQATHHRIVPKLTAD